MVAAYYSARTRVGNLGKNKPSYSAEELLSWRQTMRLKIDYAKEIYRGNSFYGAGAAMREYAGFPFPIKACIEHGLYLGDYVNPVECGDSGLPAVVTFGPSRVRHIREKSNKPVLAVGPYIAYVNGYLNGEETERAKRVVGKTLLSFPSHSIDYVEKVFDVSNYIDHLKARKLAEGFDTVLVSLYFSDLLRGAAEPYEREGFTVVTCGYREDSHFLRRLRTLICLADKTSSNSMGTHIGYCAFLEKPHHVYKQTYKTVGATCMDTENGLSASVDDAFMEESSEITEAFSDQTGVITKRQLEVCKKYWGFGCVKTPAQLSDYFAVLEKSFRDKKAYFHNDDEEICRLVRR